MNIENTCMRVHIQVHWQVHVLFEPDMCFPHKLDMMGLIVISFKIKVCVKIKMCVTVIMKTSTTSGTGGMCL